MQRNIALVTGAAGFIGRHTARELSGRGWRVTGLGHGDWPQAKAGEWGIAEWVSADVTLSALLSIGLTPRVIVHAGGGSSVGGSMTAPHDDFAKTVPSTAAVLEFARLRAPESRVVLVSSAAVYGMSDGKPLGESAPVAPVSSYAYHKRIAELLCEEYAALHRVRTCAVRLFSVYGAGLRRQLLWDACNKLRNGTAEFSGTGEETRDWLHVLDAASLLATCATSPDLENRVVNGGSGTAVSNRELLTCLARHFSPDIAVRFSGETRAGDPPHLVAERELASRLGWAPQTAWQDGLESYFQWFASGAP